MGVVTNQTIRTFKDAEERLAEALPGYESRPQQQVLASAVEAAFATNRHLMAEAGCGTGKSLGYAIPAILSGQRVVISTATKALQDQVAAKDMPFLAENLGVPFVFALLKGRSNYLCLNKATTVDPSEAPGLADILRVANANLDNPEFLGERDSFGFEIADRTWMRVAAETDDCQVFKCKNNGGCFAQAARVRAKAAQVVIVNHSLFLTDLVVKNATDGFASMIGQYQAVIFDEAHEIEDYAATAFGAQFREAGIRGLCTEVRNFGHRFLDADTADDLNELCATLLGATTALWGVLKVGRIRERNLLDNADQFVDVTNALGALAKGLASRRVLEMVAEGALEDARQTRERLQRRATNQFNRFSAVVTARFDDLVRWVSEEKNRKGDVFLALNTAPINVGDYLRPMLFDTEVTAVLTSATLAVNGTFDYVTKRLGIDEFDGIDVGTPFDFAKQAVLYIPRNLPDPTKEKAAWSALAIAEMGNLVRASQGRALLLFTSLAEMRAAHSTLKDHLPYTCLVQGTKPNKVLAQEFMDDPSSVLFAVKSFFTGVDFQGEACSLVVINKLPFPVPTEPVFEARADAIKVAGGSDFAELTIPMMSLTLKQGFGRLIRHRNDKGVVAILDPRLHKKGYGKGIIRSLPPARLVESASEAAAFFEGAS